MANNPDGALAAPRRRGSNMDAVLPEGRVLIVMTGGRLATWAHEIGKPLKSEQAQFV